MNEPPVIQVEPAKPQKVGLGRIGLVCSLAALGALAVMWLAKPG